MNWITSIFLAMICLVGHVLAVRALSVRIPPAILTPAFYTVAVAVLYGLFFTTRSPIPWDEFSSWRAILLLVAAGLTIGLTDFFFVQSMNLGASTAAAMPILFGGSTMIVAVLGVILFREDLSLAKSLGIGLTIAGITLIHHS